MANNTDWLNISQMTGGTGETALSLTALTNSSLEPKTATITARNTQYNVSDTTTVTIQGFQPTLTLSRSTLRFDSTGGTATFTVYSNTAWTISFPAIVQSYSTSAGTGDTEVTVVLAPNPDEVAKVDTGIVKDVYNVNQLYLTIVQESFIVELYVEPTDDIVFVNTGSSTSITIDSNADWELEYPSWVVPSVTSGESGTTTVTFTAGQNGPTDRSGQITVYAGSKYVTINVFQPFYIPPYITVTPSAWTFNYTEDGKTFIVDSYPGWTGEIISTGETTFDTTDAFMDATFVVPSATVMNLGDGTVFYGPIRVYGTFTASTAGTYKFRYEIPTGGTTPVINGNPYLTEITISDKVGTIAANGFINCSSLSSVTIGTGLTQIKSQPFYGCSSLKDITVYCTVAPTVISSSFNGIATGGTLHYPVGSDYSQWLSGSQHYLGYYFWNGGSPEGLENIFDITYAVTTTEEPTRILWGKWPFVYVEDEEGNKTFLTGDTYTFNSTGNRTLKLYSTHLSTPQSGNINLLSMNNIVKIQRNDTPSNLSVALPNTRTFNLTCYTNLILSGNNQSSATKKIRVLRLEGSTTRLPYTNDFSKYFSGSTELVEVHITSNNFTEIPEDAFRENTNLTAVTISEGVTKINTSAFYRCTALHNIVIPATVTQIGENVFNTCSSLTRITSLNTTAPSVYSTTFGNIARDGQLRYPAGSDYSKWLNILTPRGWQGIEI
jgi:hypothetical protein